MALRRLSALDFLTLTIRFSRQLTPFLEQLGLTHLLRWWNCTLLWRRTHSLRHKCFRHVRCYMISVNTAILWCRLNLTILLKVLNGSNHIHGFIHWFRFLSLILHWFLLLYSYNITIKLFSSILDQHFLRLSIHLLHSRLFMPTKFLQLDIRL